MSDTPAGETPKTEELKNDGSNASTQTQGNAGDLAEVERLRKEAEQARMRANQLQNQLDKQREAEEAAKQKELEDQNQWRELAEQRQARLDQLEKEREAEERSKELSQATDSVLLGFPEEVIDIAKETGLGLADTSDDAKAALKAKLEKIQARVGTQAKPSPNNPNPTQSTASREELMERMKYGDKAARKEIISNLKGVQAMKRMAGYQD